MVRFRQRWLLRCFLLIFGVFVWCGLGQGWLQTDAPISAIAAVPSMVAHGFNLAQADPGWQAYQAGRLTAAIAYWEMALTRTPSVSEQALLHRNLGQAYRQVGQAAIAIQHWERAIQFYRQEPSPTATQTMAQLWLEQAQAYLDLGQPQEAVARSQLALHQLQAHRDRPTEAVAQGVLGTAYWALGDYDQSLAAHQQSLAIACGLPNQAVLATALNNVGTVFVSQAERLRYQATAAQQEGESTDATAFNQAADRSLQVAIAAFQQSAEAGRTVAPTTAANALLNLNRLRQEFPNLAILSFPTLTCPQPNLTALLQPDRTRRPPVASNPNRAPDPANPPLSPTAARSRLLAQLAAAPNSQDKAFGYINLANQLLATPTQPPQAATLTQARDLLNQALTVAQAIQDRRTESFAVGTLGRIYELTGQYQPAIALTQQAQFLAQAVNAADSLYRWQWQAGRLLQATGQIQAAISSYEQAIGTLQTIRTDLIIANKDLQFDFRDSIEPVYRELIGLLLARGESAGVPDVPPRSQKSLEPSVRLASTAQAPLSSASTAIANPTAKALEILELLKLAELQDFFKDDCVQVAQAGMATEANLTGKPGTASTASGAIDPQAAVVYSIVLRDRSYEILRLPDGRLKQYTIQLHDQGTVMAASHAAMSDRVDRLRALLEKRSTDEYLPAAQQMYDALIRPLEADLQAAQPKALVFISDGMLRKLPMGALHDGQQFLIQKYPIATTPSLSLTSRRPLDRARLNALVMGLTLEQPPFAALPNVRDEVQEVHRLLGGTQLLDQDFTLQRVEEKLMGQRYRIVHMATHGKFGGDPDNTFLLTYGDRISLNTLDQVLQTRKAEEPIELLTLSACQTAAGDERSALGIAGLAVRAGVKSALATLWFINDEATVPLIDEFYSQLLKPGVTKAQALQQAQIKLIDDLQYNHPAVWAAFTLIGNWL